MAVQRHSGSFGTADTRQHACNFLLLIHLGPILPRMKN